MMTREELQARFEEAIEDNTLDEDFAGSSSEAAEAEGKCDAYSNGLGWVLRYFETNKPSASAVEVTKS